MDDIHKKYKDIYLSINTTEYKREENIKLIDNKINECNDINISKIQNILDIINKINDNPNLHNEFIDKSSYMRDKLLLNDKIHILDTIITKLETALKDIINTYNIHKHIENKQKKIQVKPLIK